MNREPQTPQHSQDPIPGRRGRRGGAHRGRRPRRGAVTLGVVALIAVTGGGYGAVQALSGSDGTRVDTASESVAAPDVPRSGGPSASASATASDRTSAGPSGSPTKSPAKRSATPKATPTKKATPDRSRTQAPAVAPQRTAASGAGSGSVKKAQPGSAPEGGTTGRLAQQVIEMVNAERAKSGCAPVTSNAKLRAAAQGHSDDMAARNYYDHSTPEGVRPGDRITRAGYRWSTYAENIFKSPKDARTAMDGWMKSSGHRANILNCSFKEIGVGINLSSNGPWWTQNFGASS